MTITITLDHSDIIGTETREFESLFCILQAYAKMTRGSFPPDSLSSAQEEVKEEVSTKADSELKAEHDEPTENNSSYRKKIESEIKQIALDGKEKGISKKIKLLIQGYGVEKLNEVPDDKLKELLEKVKAL